VTLDRAGMWMLLLACPSSAVWAQQATVSRNVVLHRDPSTRSKALEHLIEGERLTLVDATPDGGFYHVKTEDDLVGWVSSGFIKVSAAPITPAPETPSGPQPTESSCDARLWSHVYHPPRLIVKQQCISVTGTIVDASGGKPPDGVRHEKDGDAHGWLKVDSDFEKLLNAGNMSNEGGTWYSRSSAGSL